MPGSCWHQGMGPGPRVPRGVRSPGGQPPPQGSFVPQGCGWGRGGSRRALGAGGPPAPRPRGVGTGRLGAAGGGQVGTAPPPRLPPSPPDPPSSGGAERARFRGNRAAPAGGGVPSRGQWALVDAPRPGGAAGLGRGGSAGGGSAWGGLSWGCSAGGHSPRPGPFAAGGGKGLRGGCPPAPPAGGRAPGSPGAVLRRRGRERPGLSRLLLPRRLG